MKMLFVRPVVVTGKLVGLLAACFIVFMLSAHDIRAADPDGYRVVDGMSIYLGVLPSELLRDRSRSPGERTMHGGTPRGLANYHVLVAVFNQATGERLTGLSVTATVHAHDRMTSTKVLEPMTVAETLTYGNYFPMSSSGEHQITIEISRPGAAAIRAEFTHIVPAR